LFNNVVGLTNLLISGKHPAVIEEFMQAFVQEIEKG
jgi:hypothetical protein